MNPQEKPYQKRPSWLRILCMIGCCEIFAFTREGFGGRYWWLLIACFFIRATLLIPVPITEEYMGLQFFVSLIFFLQFVGRLTPTWRANIASLERYLPGKPGRTLFLFWRHTLLTRFIVEPGIAFILYITMVAHLEPIADGTFPFYFVWAQYLNPHFQPEPYLDSSIVHYFQGFFTGINRETPTAWLIFSFPICTILNNALEMHAEYAKPKPAKDDPAPEPQLVFEKA